MNKFIDSSSFDTFLKPGSNYGVDPYLLLAKAMTESSLMHNAVLPGGANFNNHAWGLMQIENVHIGEVISAYNYKTQQMDTIKITQESLKNLDTNVQIASMMFQKQLHKYQFASSFESKIAPRVDVKLLTEIKETLAELLKE